MYRDNEDVTMCLTSGTGAHKKYYHVMTTRLCYAFSNHEKKLKLHGLSTRANYTDRATAACRQSDCQLFADRGCYVVSVTDPYGPYSRFSRQEPLLFYEVAPQFVLTRLSGPRSRPTTYFFW
jgi:hypothetical protein